MLGGVRLRLGLVTGLCAAACGDDAGDDGGDSLGDPTLDATGTGTTGTGTTGTGTTGTGTGDAGTSGTGVDSVTGGGSTFGGGEPEMWPKEGCFLQAEGFFSCAEGCALLDKTCVDAGCPEALGRVMEQYEDEATCDSHEAFAWGQACDDVFSWAVPLARCCCQ